MRPHTAFIPSFVHSNLRMRKTKSPADSDDSSSELRSVPSAVMMDGSRPRHPEVPPINMLHHFISVGRDYESNEKNQDQKKHRF